MSHRIRQQFLNRRHFLQRIIPGVGGMAWLSRMATRGMDDRASNPYAYDLAGWRRTDARLVQYEELRRIRGLRDDVRRIAIDSAGTLFVAAGNYVTVFNSDGTHEDEIAFEAPVRCVGVGGDASIYAGLRDHVEVIDKKGRRATWSSAGKRSWFTGLAISETEVFVADAGNRLIWRYDHAGNQLGRIGERNLSRNIPGFIIPSPFFDVKLHRDGLLRVTNPGRHHIEAYTHDGELELSWGKPSFAIDGFAGCCNPVALALLADGRVVTCEKGLPRVKIYAANGSFESVVAGVESFSDNARSCGPDDCTSGGLDVAVDAHDRIYILDPVGRDIRVMVRKRNARTETTPVRACAG